MKRRLFMPLVLLTVGATINVAVAWVVPQYGPMWIVLTQPPANMRTLDRSDEAVGVLADDASLTGFAQQRFYESWGGWAFNRDVVYATDGVSNRSITHLRCGWPMRCLSGTDTTGIGLQDAIEVPEWLTQGGNWGGRFFLPTQPMWLGFVVNTAFYAMVAWMVFFGPFALRRWRRIKRGRCVRCGYDLQGNAGGAKCPECGALR